MRTFGYVFAAVLTLVWLYGAYRVFKDGIKLRRLKP
jgi:hypothetical protein